MDDGQIILELKEKLKEGKSFVEIQDLLRNCSKSCAKLGNVFQDKLRHNKIIDYVILFKKVSSTVLIFLINALTSNLNNKNHYFPILINNLMLSVDNDLDEETLKYILILIYNCISQSKQNTDLFIKSGLLVKCMTKFIPKFINSEKSEVIYWLGLIFIYLIFFPDIIFLIIKINEEINFLSIQLFQFIIEEILINLNNLKSQESFILVHYQLSLVFEKISQTFEVSIFKFKEIENNKINDKHYEELKLFNINCIKAISFYNELLSKITEEIPEKKWDYSVNIINALMICLKAFRFHSHFILDILNYNLKDELYLYMRPVTVLLNGNIKVYNFFIKNREYIKLIINLTNEYIDQMGLREWSVLAIRLFLENPESRPIIQELMGNNIPTEEEILKNSSMKIIKTEI